MRSRSHDERLFARALADGDANALLFFESRYRGLIRHALAGAVAHAELEPLTEGRWPASEVEALLRDFVRWLHHDDGQCLRAYKGRCAFGAWLYAVALRYFQGRLAREVRTAATDAATAAPSLTPLFAGGAAETPRPTDDGARLREAVRALHPLDRLYVRLFFVEGLDAEAVARTLGRRANAVHARKVRILEKLAALLDEPVTTPDPRRRAVGR